MTAALLAVLLGAPPVVVHAGAEPGHALAAELDGAVEDIIAIEGLVAELREKRRGGRRLRELERRVNELKARIFRAKVIHPHPYGPQVEPPPPAEPVAISGAEFARLVDSLREASFRDDKLRVLRAAAPEMHFTTAQARQLAELLTFGEDRVEALALLHPRLTDPQNFHTAYRLLVHTADRAALDRKIREGE